MPDELYRLHRLTLSAPDETLFAAISTAIPGLTRHKARLAVSAGLVKVGGAVILEPKSPVPAKAAVVVDLRQGIPRTGLAVQAKRAGPTARPFTVLFQDEHLIVVDKACGILSAPTHQGEKGALPALIRGYLRKRDLPSDYIGVVHRIDKETSGCLVFALSHHAQRMLGQQFAGEAVTRRYRCLVAGEPRQDQDRLTGRLGRGHDGRRAVVDDDAPGKDAVTRFRVLSRHHRWSELEAELETGRTHQIRVHLAGIGCPVLGDPVYGPRDGRDRQGRPLPKASRLMLHAFHLGFDHPVTGERVEIEAPLPPEFAAQR